MGGELGGSEGQEVLGGSWGPWGIGGQVGSVGGWGTGGVHGGDWEGQAGSMGTLLESRRFGGIRGPTESRGGLSPPVPGTTISSLCMEGNNTLHFRLHKNCLKQFTIRR